MSVNLTTGSKIKVTDHLDGTMSVRFDADNIDIVRGAIMDRLSTLARHTLSPTAQAHYSYLCDLDDTLAECLALLDPTTPEELAAMMAGE